MKGRSYLSSWIRESIGTVHKNKNEEKKEGKKERVKKERKKDRKRKERVSIEFFFFLNCMTETFPYLEVTLVTT